MLETPHVVVGAAIAYKIGDPLLALPLAFGSHFILEKVPHWNPHLNTELKKLGKVSSKSVRIIVIDSLTSLFLGITIASLVLPNTAHAATILAACFFSALPDLIEAPYYFLKQKSNFIEKVWIPFKKSIQVDTSIVPGLTTQILTTIAALWWILI
ncbi:hypothetical protein A2714_02025 [Candidatus Woesebacteria bacterium RIFCSPHIGHO2_01_FULL_38_9]|uniref:Uncharacterized protein n=2 Tax=Candidatus Woeseibacteriota TaxID=1752722 RepID=A0A1F7Y1E5_9BACT|nr:MAG: hypothetical protein A2714_02025 [Candidatus Woesebacteria bacterium RIFCSPHIGHO2_01_FULL_38_9]OGM60176.1 MAG: hypothetical protein A3A75_05750 [Candidatus Woesebacteria bacterium RIFCSPLOWO2_01_FULL_39_10]